VRPRDNPARERRSLSRIFAIPVALFVVSLFGLIASLLFHGWPDIVFAIAAGSAVFALIWSAGKNRA
jgi:hypothetical protein